LKAFLKNTFYLYICTQIWGTLQAQNLSLILEAEKEVPTTLLDSLGTSFSFRDFPSLKSEIDTLSAKLQHVGYLESTLNQLTKRDDSTFIATYFLGNRWKEITLYFNKEDFPSNEIKRVNFTTTDSSLTIPIEKVPSTLLRLTQLKTENGHAFAKLQLSKIEKVDSKKLTAFLNFTPGPTRTIDGIVVKGYEKFPMSFLKYYAGVKKGRAFKQRKIVSQNNTLSNLGFVTSIKPPEALFRKDSTYIYFYLKKANNNRFDGILGFASNEKTQKVEFNGFLDIELNNNLNYGEQLVINYKADGRDQQSLKVYTKLPYLFKTPLGLSLELNIFKRDSSFSTTHQEARIHYQASPKANIFLGYKSYESSNLLEESNVGNSVEDFTARFFLGGLEYQISQNEKLFPVKSQLVLDTEIGERKTATNKNAQVKINGTLMHSFNLNARNSIFLKSTTSMLSSPRFLANELFRFGGINSIRGFAENSIDASLFSVLNTEYRYLLNNNTYLHSIIDIAYFENQLLTTKDELYSFGIGMGLNTNAGIFKINIANGFSQNQTVGFSNTKIHLSFSSRF